jgi:hypothetical protein
VRGGSSVSFPLLASDGIDLRAILELAAKIIQPEKPLSG